MKKSFILILLMFVPFIVHAEEEKLIDHIQAIADNAGGDTTSMNVIGDTGLAYDGTVDNNLRYVGADPNNYIMFNGELWRIIGIMNNIDDGEGNLASRIKIIRDESIGSYAWSPSPAEVNEGKGDNEWTYSNALKVLTYYYNKEKGACRDRDYNEIECDFSNNGLSEGAKNIIIPVVWTIGAVGDSMNTFGFKVVEAYSYERSTRISIKDYYYPETSTGFPGSVRKSTWVGNIGLIYPSDYGYATTGSAENSKYNCTNSYYFGINHYQPQGWQHFGGCYSNDWLLMGSTLTDGYWSMNPFYNGYNATFSISQREPKNTSAKAVRSIYPVVFLKDNVYLYAGDGSHDNPYLITGFNVTVIEGKDNISVSKDSDLSEGSTVTITVSKEGFKLKELKILDSDGSEVEYTKISDIEYKFIMPASDVRVLAEFLEIEKEETPKEENPKEEKKNPNTIDMIILAMVILTISLFAGIYFYIKYSNNKENLKDIK